MPQHDRDLSSEAKQLESDPVLAAHGFERDKAPRNLKTFLFPTFVLTFFLSLLLMSVFGSVWFISLNLIVVIVLFLLFLVLRRWRKASRSVEA